MIISEREYDVSTMRALSRASLPYIAKIVDRWLPEVDQNVEVYNRRLFDSVQLLKGDWSENPAWNFTTVDQLTVPDVNDDTPEVQSVLRKLEAALLRSSKSTYKDYTKFREAISQDCFSDTKKYLAWFEKNLPYLVLGVDASLDGLGEAKNRLEWFVSKVPDKSDLKENMMSYGERYIMSWYEQRKI